MTTIATARPASPRSLTRPRGVPMLPPLAAVVLVALLAACGSGQPAPASSPAATQASVQMPGCLAGHGSDGSDSTLTITPGTGGRFTGTYINHAPGMAAGTGIRYMIEGQQLSGQRFSSTWTVGGSATITVTGSWTATMITLDDPSHQFGTTEFSAATSCPP